MLAGYLFVFLPTLLRRLRRDKVASLYHRFSNADLVAELKAVSEHLKLTSRLDGLTGIANRAHLDYCLERAWRRCHRARRRCRWCWWMWTTSSNSTTSMAISWGRVSAAGGGSAGRGAAARGRSRRPLRRGGVRPAAALYQHAGALQIAENVRVALKDLSIPHQKSLVSYWVSCSFGVATLVPDQSLSISELIQKRMRPLPGQA